MSKKVLVTEEVDAACIEVLRKRGCDVEERFDLSAVELAGIVGDYDALVVRSHTPVTRTVLEAGERLRVIGRAGVSVDNIDIAAATERGIVVCNAPTSNIISVAEQTMALILSCARNVAQGNASMHAGEWEPGRFKGVELYEKTLAVFGLGRVGGLVAERAAAFGMKLVGFDPYCSNERAASLGVRLCDDIADILPIADVITVHLPKTPETIGMFGPLEFAAMKDGVILVNAARGGIYDEKALSDFVAAGKIAAVGLDVFESEPCRESPLHEFDNALLTPRLGALTIEAQRRAGVQIANYVMQGLSGSLVPTALNLAPAPPEIFDALGPYVTACEMMGSMLSQFKKEVPRFIKLTTAGTLAGADAGLFVASLLKGLLAYKNVGALTPANSESVAARHGIKIETFSRAEASGYASAVAVVADGMELSCTLSDASRRARIVSLFGYDLDIAPAHRSLVFKYVDAPGRVGIIGTILGQAGINITTMQIGTRDDSDCAIVYLNIEGDVAPEVLAALEEGIDDLKNLWYITM